MSAQAARRVAAALGLAVALACSSSSDTPESRVRAVLAALEDGARERDAGAMKAHVSGAYADAQGNDEHAIAALVTLHLMRNRSVHLLTRVTSVTLPEPGHARVEALVAMAGTPIPTAAELASVRADLYRFELELRQEPDGEWRVTSADWRPASVGDFQ
jgi:hypothetical protein